MMRRIACMNRTRKALLIKAGVTMAASWFTLSLIDVNSFGWVLMAALLTTLINYGLGDLVVLPNLGNMIASLCDGAMAAFIPYLFEIVVPVFEVSTVSLSILAAVITIFEFFFHTYMENMFNEDNERNL